MVQEKRHVETGGRLADLGLCPELGGQIVGKGFQFAAGSALQYHHQIRGGAEIFQEIVEALRHRRVLGKQRLPRGVDRELRCRPAGQNRQHQGHPQDPPRVSGKAFGEFGGALGYFHWRGILLINPRKQPAPPLSCPDTPPTCAR